jgi:hypothetical protein
MVCESPGQLNKGARPLRVKGLVGPISPVFNSIWKGNYIRRRKLNDKAGPATIRHDNTRSEAPENERIPALTSQKRRELLRFLISASPYRRVLSKYEEEIDRVAAGHAQIAQIMADYCTREHTAPRRHPRDPQSKKQLRLLLDFLEFIYFSTPETYKGLSRER